MHLSSHAFISAFLPLYFSVDTDNQQCFKNIHTKKDRKSLLLSTPPRFARDTQGSTLLCLPIGVVFHSRAPRSSRRLRQQTLLFTPLFVRQALQMQSHLSGSCKRAGKDQQK